MNRFNCLELDCPLFGPHILEASAGTGKTFTIEHVFVRLIINEIPLEEILTVTFTRAATRELKARIRFNLEKALSCIRSENVAPPPYLLPYIGSEEALFLLTQALKNFDRCQIFTIHSFCFRMLKEFAFEAGELFSLQDPEDLHGSNKKMRSALATFWHEGIDAQSICPEQLAILFSEFETMQEMGFRLIQAKTEEKPFATFEDLHKRFAKALKGRSLVVDIAKGTEDFEALRGGYKAQKGDFAAQVEYLCQATQRPEDPRFFRKLIQHKGSLFSFLSPANKKVKQKEIKNLHYPGFFDWAAENLTEIVAEAAESKNIFSCLAKAWKEWERKTVSLEGIFRPDEILEQMKEAIKLAPFLSKLQRRFKAVIIDEFQDTDPLQWEIFHHAFIESSSLKALYLVGDPKQSIYRFRRADVYTYLEAKERLKENIYHLDTNYRSTKEMIGSLNALFSRKWLLLPKTNDYIPYTPVQAGSAILSDFQDGKKALHWMIGDEDTFIPFAVAEIEKINPPSFKSIAILVKDRYELQKALKLLQERNIPCVAKSHLSLASTFSFLSLREVFDAILSPFNENAAKIADFGPYRTKNTSFLYWNEFLEQEGLAKFFSAYFADIPKCPDLMQTMEELFAWEQREGFSFDGLKRFFNEFEKLEVEEGSRRRMEEEEDAVQVLTLHISKGLEFDVVFALALASLSSTEEEEKNELDAEKLRQLYVAMTRAKKRLYVPFSQTKNGKKQSPMDLFSSEVEKQEGPFLPYLERLAKTASISYEYIPQNFSMPPCTREPKKALEKIKPPKAFYTPSYIHSFTTLAQEKKIEVPEVDPTDLPRGKETGTIIHSLFEAIFESEDALWKEDANIEELVEKKLRYTPLKAWTSLIKTLICKTIALPLFDGNRTFSLRELNQNEVLVEMEFLYAKEPHYIVGFIDLVFEYQGKIYLIDWKTNKLNSATPEGIDEMMQAHDYELQAEVYTEALRRHFGTLKQFGGAFYLFLRSGSYVYFIPNTRVRHYG